MNHDEEDVVYEPDVYLEEGGDEEDAEFEDIEEVEVEEIEEDENISFQRIMATLFAMQPDDGGQTTGSRNRSSGGRSSGLRLSNLNRLLGSFRSGSLVQSRFLADDEDDDDGDWVNSPGRERRPQPWFPEVTEPQQAGVDLLMSGDFGLISTKIKSQQNNLDMNVAKRLNNWSSKRYNHGFREEVASNLIPNSNGVTVASYEANVYCGQYSTDSSFYYTCSQDFRMHVYDTTAPPVKTDFPTSRRHPDGHSSTMKVIKIVNGVAGRWTITDSHLSPDNRNMIYSSITPIVHMTSTLDSSPHQIPLNFADPPRRRGFFSEESDYFGIWSCRFSADGNEVIAGGNENIFVYDLLAHQRTVKIDAHKADVNSCCWADTASGNVLVSASDDAFLKVWDRRSLGSSQKPSGVLIGHTEGITNVSAKGDGRYIISNGKDQALRLWDLRKMRTSNEYEEIAQEYYGASHFDYRYGRYPKPKYLAHPKDCSVMTYRGHSVLRTLIRCHFSPAETTGSQYLYSGSADGRVHIWSLDGRIIQILDRARTLPMSCDSTGPEPQSTEGVRHNICVRDVSWHSQAPIMMSAGWESGNSGSVVARHEWKGLQKSHGGLEDWVEKQRQESAEASSRPTAAQHVPGAYE